MNGGANARCEQRADSTAAEQQPYFNNRIKSTYSYASINWFRFKGFDLRTVADATAHPLGRAAR